MEYIILLKPKSVGDNYNYGKIMEYGSGEDKTKKLK
jgi:hypothetical protein